MPRRSQSLIWQAIYDAAKVKDILSLMAPPDKTLNLMRSISACFYNYIDNSDVDAADSELRSTLSRRIVHNNESILKIDCALAEPLRFSAHNHKDEYLIGSVLIADSASVVDELIGSFMVQPFVPQLSY